MTRASSRPDDEDKCLDKEARHTARSTPPTSQGIRNFFYRPRLSTNTSSFPKEGAYAVERTAFRRWPGGLMTLRGINLLALIISSTLHPPPSILHPPDSSAVSTLSMTVADKDRHNAKKI
ncbi:hypothetical protein EYF80_026355 [Liparis tanakae]|uniref:Uncharacterized protein n=1 Tax=Liparis tanakae TaxID=230148 RepID=A0A4Z2HC46_9TELE|nr:hypothetical protein EYF80_026355 [Liparis tanakae]